jgi:hypothetical protein
VTRVEPEAARPPDPFRGVAQHVGGQIGHLAATGTLRMQVLGTTRRGRRRQRVHQVVGGQTSVEMYVSKHTGARQPFQRAVHRRAMNRRVAARHLVEQGIGRQVLSPGGDHARQQGNARLGDALSRSPQQVGRLSCERLAATTRHVSSLHRRDRPCLQTQVISGR